uniref:Uncharacterized protein n=1 Tax=Gossypium raimondii TaxID=29730 RepID=A0A0D2UFX1_GOSRA|nr:hypothetical protein B456_010G204500 [Gossypium raimondii]
METWKQPHPQRSRILTRNTVRDSKYNSSCKLPNTFLLSFLFCNLFLLLIKSLYSLPLILSTPPIGIRGAGVTSFWRNNIVIFIPYQIWEIRRMLGSPRLSAVNEDKEYLAKTIDKCQENSSCYQIQAGVDLMAKAKYLLQERNYQFRTDGRRILAYHSYLIEENDEGINLLKKIADMNIEDFPSNILQQIRSTWENYHQYISTIHHLEG